MLEQLNPTARSGVARRHHGHRLRPHDPQVLVSEGHGDVRAWLMRTIDSVTDVGGGGQGLESMQKASRNVEVAKLFIIEQESPVLAEGRRALADIDDDVVNGAVRTPDQFGLAQARTAMQAADHTLGRSGLRILDECGRCACLADEFVEQCSVKGSGEQTAGVVNRIRYENGDTSEVRPLNSHVLMMP